MGRWANPAQMGHLYDVLPDFITAKRDLQLASFWPPFFNDWFAIYDPMAYTNDEREQCKRVCDEFSDFLYSHLSILDPCIVVVPKREESQGYSGREDGRDQFGRRERE